MRKNMLSSLIIIGGVLLTACAEAEIEKDVEALHEVEGVATVQKDEEEKVELVEAVTEEVTKVEEPKPEPQSEPQSEPVKEETQNIGTSAHGSTMTRGLAASIVEEYLYNKSDMSTFNYNNGHIEITMSNIPTKDEAVVSYSMLGDELLFYEGVQSLTVNFVDWGKVSFSIGEAETNEYGTYFPTLGIEAQLGVTYDW